jgi:hypothetical protein
MVAVASMNAEAARCFRRACEANDPLDQTIFIGLRQAWLALALQIEQRAVEPPRLITPDVSTVEDRRRVTNRKPHKPRSSRKSLKAGAGRKPTPRARQRKLAA